MKPLYLRGKEEYKTMKELKHISLFAGVRPDGQPVAETVQAKTLGPNEYQLVRAPSFVKGLASGDTIAFDENDNSFDILKRSGNLCVRVFAKENIASIRDDITPRMEKLGGMLDFENERLLVYTIHVSCGFQAVEQIFNDHIDEDEGQMWVYGNIYDPEDGVTPLNWWQNILNEK